MKPRRPFRFEMDVIVHAHRKLIAVPTSYRSSFLSFLDELFKGVFGLSLSPSKPSHRNFLTLAIGFTFAHTRHTIASYLWRAGSFAWKHFTRYYVFFGAPFYRHLDQLWQIVIMAALEHVPDDEMIRVRFPAEPQPDETTCKKTGAKIDGTDRYRNGAGTARQEYRTLFGLNFVLGELRIRLSPWPEHFVSVPIGLALYLKENKAHELGLPYQSRSQLARTMLDRVAALAGTNRTVLSVQDGDYSTKEFLRDLPENVRVVGRLPVSSPLYAAPAPKPPHRRGRQAKKGRRIGTPKTLAEDVNGALRSEGWQAHPDEEGAEIRVVEGLWHSVMPGVMLRVVLVRRKALPTAKSQKRRRKWLEAFFTSVLGFTEEQLLEEYGGRWSIRLRLSREITIREARESYGLGRDRCRRYRRIVGVNAFRLLMGASQVLWFAREVKPIEEMDLTRYQAWYLQKAGPSLYDIAWGVRERLLAEGITPTVGFWEGLGVIHGLHAEESQPERSRAA